MAYYDTTWYANSVGYSAVTAWAATTAIAAGALRRQLAAPAVNSERVFIAIIAGTTGSTEPTWVLTRGAKTTDGTVTWMECTGIAAVNGDLTNTVNWTAAKAIGTPTLGTIIQRISGTSYQICTTAGTLGASEPAFSDTAGVTTTETSATTVWTSLGVVGNWTTKGAAPHARLQNVFGTSWFIAGNTIYVGDNHAESQANQIIVGPVLTAATVSRVICHNHSGSYPPTSPTTGATISTTGANINLTHNTGSLYFYGITFKAGVGSSSITNILINTINAWTYFDSCSLQIASTAGNLTINFGSTNNVTTFILNNTTVSFGATSQRIDLSQCQFIWQNTGQVLAGGSAVPVNFMYSSSAGQQPVAVLEALDLSQLTGNLVIGFGWGGSVLIKDCKLNASAVIAVQASMNLGQIVQVVRSDSGATAYKSARYNTDGSETTETLITRVGGASDPTGQAQSRKIVTTVNSQWLRPFKAEPYAIWNAVTGANVTVTVCGTVNAGALPNNDDIWMDVEYLTSNVGATAPPTIESHNHSISSGGTTATIAVNASGAGRVIVVCATIGAGNTGIIPTATISSSDPNIGSWTSIGHMPVVSSVGVLVQAWYAIASGPVSAATVTVTAGSTIDDAALAYITVTGANTAALLDQNSTLAIGSSNGSAAKEGTISTPLNATISTNNANTLVFALIGTNANRTYANPTTGTTLTETITNGGGVRFAVIGVYTAPFTTQQSGTSVGSTDSANDPLFAFALTAVAPPAGILGTIVNTTKANLLAANAAVASDGSSWNGGGSGAGWSPFKLVATLSSPQPGMAGLIYVRPNIAKQGATFYLDPNPVLS